MKNFGELFQVADWKKENMFRSSNVRIRSNQVKFFPVKITVGKDNPHPNTTEHHIRWITVNFLAEGEKFPYEVGRFELILTVNQLTDPTRDRSIPTRKSPRH